MKLNQSSLFLTSFVTAASLALIFLAGCADSSGTSATASGETKSSEATSATGGAKGELNIAGSDTVLPLAQRWAEEFKKSHPGVSINVTGGGSGQGITALVNGSTDIANASRKIKEKELQLGKSKGIDIKETSVARDGITIVVNKSNPIKMLTLDQLKGIYTGKITNWKQIGGADLRITTSGRDTSSGTYAYFQEDVLGNEKYRADMKATPSNNAIASNVAQEAGGIGYIGVAYATEYVKVGKVREVPVAFKEGETATLPTTENILSGKYPISRALYCYTNGEPSGNTKEFLDYVTGTGGQKVVKEVGFITLK